MKAITKNKSINNKSELIDNTKGKTIFINSDGTLAESRESYYEYKRDLKKF
jgi:hypothetical protein